PMNTGDLDIGMVRIHGFRAHGLRPLPGMTRCGSSFTNSEIEEHMNTLFLGGLAARVAPRIIGKMTEQPDATLLADLTAMQRLMPALAEAEIVVGHIWRPD